VLASALGPTGALVAGLGILLAASAIAVVLLFRRNRALARLRLHDPQTGLPNQVAFWRIAPAKVPASADEPLALVCVEIDHYKELTGLYGHLAAESRLTRLAELMQDVAPAEAHCFRYGDSELLILAPGCEESEGIALAERLQAALRSLPERSPEITVSAGVASMTGGRQAAELVVAAKLFDEADRALRVAKRNGRETVVPASSPDVSDFDLLDPEIEAARRAAIEMARATLGARDEETATHSDEVVELAQAIGQSLGLDPDERQKLQLAAGLHDIGKIAMPRRILNKPGPLDDREWILVKEHTVIGERILRSVPELAPAATAVRHAHERWDGEGYPDGLAGEEIPLCSRVVLCADAFHAIRSDRPYRAGRSSSEALDEIRAHSGTQFDPEVVGALERVAAAARRSGSRFSRRTIALLATCGFLLAGTALADMAGWVDVPLIGSAGGSKPHAGSTPSDRSGTGKGGVKGAKHASGKGSAKGASGRAASARRDGVKADRRDTGRGGLAKRDGGSGGAGQAEQDNGKALGLLPGNPGRGAAWGQGDGGGRYHPKK
jgi:diguanylate cyclase (GGDEF)-like protein